MHGEYLFAMALGITAPWKVVHVEFKESTEDHSRELYINIDFQKGSKFKDEHGILCDIHDTKERTWRHLNFFQHACYITCRVPRMPTSEGKVK